LVNFIEIFHEIPKSLLVKRGYEIVSILQERLKEAVKSYNMASEEDYSKILVCNNACWAIGEIAMKCPDQVQPFLVNIINALADILSTDILEKLSQKDEQLLKHFAKTVSITLGRIGKLDPQGTAFCLPKVIKPWCIALRYISGSEEKSQAFRGLCAMIPYNPIGIAESFPYFCEALIEFNDPPEELEYIF
jgi:transportin-1